MTLTRTKILFALMGGIVLIAFLVMGLGYITTGGMPGGSSPVYERSSGGGVTVQQPPVLTADRYGYWGDGIFEMFLRLLFSGGFWLFMAVIIGGFFVFRARSQKNAITHVSPFHNISPVTAIFSTLLTLALVVLFARIWLDLENWVSVGQSAASVSEHLAVLFAHTMFIVTLTSSSFLIYYALKKEQSINAIVSLPYFVVSVVFSAWLLLETASFALTNLGNAGVYIVLFFVVIVFSALLVLALRWEHGKNTTPPNQLV